MFCCARFLLSRSYPPCDLNLKLLKDNLKLLLIAPRFCPCNGHSTPLLLAPRGHETSPSHGPRHVDEVRDFPVVTSFPVMLTLSHRVTNGELELTTFELTGLTGGNPRLDPRYHARARNDASHR